MKSSLNVPPSIFNYERFYPSDNCCWSCNTIFEVTWDHLLLDQTLTHHTFNQSINQSINQFININTWDGASPIIRARGSCIKRMTIKY